MTLKETYRNETVTAGNTRPVINIKGLYKSFGKDNDILKGIKYPSDKNTILNSVIGRNTDKKISELLGQIEDKLYNNASEVATATGLVERE